MSLKFRIFLLIFIEIGYFAIVRYLLRHAPWWSIEAELVRTMFRVISASLDWLLFRDLIKSRMTDAQLTFNSSLSIGVAFFLLIPLLVGNYALPNKNALLFAITSIPVAIKEELLFRGILQNLFSKKMKSGAVILVTSIVFMIYHIGTFPISLWVYSQVFIASLILGLIYSRSGSILLVIAIHGAYDVLFSLSPFPSPPLNVNWGFIPLFASLGFTYWWCNNSSKKVAAAIP